MAFHSMEAPVTLRCRRRSAAVGFTLVELLVVIAIIGVLVSLLLPAVQAAREAARRTKCGNNLRNLALGAINYHDSKKHFPLPTTNRVGSNDDPIRDQRLFSNWAIATLPFIEQQALANRFQITDLIRLWNPGNDVNLEPRGQEIEVMLCPSDEGAGQKFADSGGNWARGNYGLNGFQFWPNSFLAREAAGDPAVSATDFSKYLDFAIGMGGINGPKMNIKRITDGTTNTIMLAEMRVGLSPRDRRGVWAMGMCGSNFHCRHAYNGITGPNSCKDGGDDTYGAPNIIADVGEATMRQECMHTNEDNSGQSTVRSRHTGGAFIAMADGSVRFVSDFIDGGSVGTGGYLGSTPPGVDTLEQNFGAWQRLNISADGYVVQPAT